MTAADTPDWQSVQVTPPAFLQTLSVLPNATTTFPLTPPTGTHGLAFVSPDSSGRLSLVSVRGHVSGDFYFAVSGGGGIALAGTAVVVPIVIDPSYESQLDVAMASLYVAGAHPVDVFAVLDVEALVNSSSNPLFVAFPSSQQVSVLAGDSKTALVSNALVANTPVQLVAGVAGQVIRVLGVTVAPDAAVAGSQLNFTDGNGGATKVSVSGVLAAPEVVDLTGGGQRAGVPLTAGNGLFMVNGQASTWRGTVIYTQG